MPKCRDLQNDEGFVLASRSKTNPEKGASKHKSQEGSFWLPFKTIPKRAPTKNPQVMSPYTAPSILPGGLKSLLEALALEISRNRRVPLAVRQRALRGRRRRAVAPGQLALGLSMPQFAGGIYWICVSLLGEPTKRMAFLLKPTKGGSVQTKTATKKATALQGNHYPGAQREKLRAPTNYIYIYAHIYIYIYTHFAGPLSP